MDYCNTKEQTTKNPLMKDYLIAASNGNKDAYSFLWCVWNWSQAFDDLIDGEYKEASDGLQHGESAIKEFVGVLHTVNYNDFYLKYKDQLYPLLVQMAHRVIIGDEWESSEDNYKRQSAYIIRCGDLDLFSHVSYLTGGWGHMRELAKFRRYDRNINKEGIS